MDKYLWKELTAAAKKVIITANINPNMVLMARAKYRLSKGNRQLRRAGVKIVGYVPTNYGKRDIKAVQ